MDSSSEGVPEPDLDEQANIQLALKSLKAIQVPESSEKPVEDPATTLLRKFRPHQKAPGQSLKDVAAAKRVKIEKYIAPTFQAINAPKSGPGSQKAPLDLTITQSDTDKPVENPNAAGISIEDYLDIYDLLPWQRELLETGLIKLQDVAEERDNDPEITTITPAGWHRLKVLAIGRAPKSEEDGKLDKETPAKEG
jgi:hypothetical protein